MRSRFVLLSGALALGLACGGSDEPPAPGVEVSEDGRRVEIRDESGAHAVVAPDAGLPRDFPKDEVPLPDDATVTTFVEDESPGGRGFTLHLEVDDVAKAAQQHRQKLQQAGFTISNEETASGMGGSFESYRARTDSWHVTVIAANEAGRERNLMMVNVVPASSEAPDDDAADGAE